MVSVSRQPRPAANSPKGPCRALTVTATALRDASYHRGHALDCHSTHLSLNFRFGRSEATSCIEYHKQDEQRALKTSLSGLQTGRGCEHTVASLTLKPWHEQRAGWRQCITTTTTSGVIETLNTLNCAVYTQGQELVDSKTGKCEWEEQLLLYASSTK